MIHFILFIELDIPPHNGLLDNSKLRQRPKKNPINRPPSKTNLVRNTCTLYMYSVSGIENVE